MAKRFYAGVIAEYKIDGRVFPRIILMEDGRKVGIHRVKDVRQAASLKCVDPVFAMIAMQWGVKS